MKITCMDRLRAKSLHRKFYRYIARDKDGQLFLYYYKPTKSETRWWHNSGRAYTKPNTFKGITWQDKEPVCIKHIVNKVW